MKIALAQTNPRVGDLRGNSRKLVDFAVRAHSMGADLVVFPELSLEGYPPQDLLESEAFIADAVRARTWTASQAPPDLGMILGGIARNRQRPGNPLFNAAFLYEGGKELARIHKSLLPTYDVFDERRYFEPGQQRSTMCWRGTRLGVHVCEDLWYSASRNRYAIDPLAELAAQHAQLFVNICASPFAMNKRREREKLALKCSRTYGVPFVLVNQVGANTELVFDGCSIACSAEGVVGLRAPAFRERLVIWDTGRTSSESESDRPPVQDLHDALVLGIRDYYQKTGVFTKALVGLSGGIDSAVTCCLAAEALGPDRVVGVTMPSAISSRGSVEDSSRLANNLGIEFHRCSITTLVAAFGDTLGPYFEGTESGVAEENIQARTRGTLLMALSNKFSYLLLSTGNKSESAVGYATLYGDMNGGLAVLGDVLKTQVYDLGRYINAIAAGEPPIPQSTLSKPPSAELRPDQTDQDSLPPYSVLDEILRCYVEGRQTAPQISGATGYDEELVSEILHRVDRNEYKRWQAPPSIRVTSKAFGAGRRLPLVMRRT